MNPNTDNTNLPDTATSLLAMSYREKGYVSHFNKIEFDVVKEANKCVICQGRLRYIGLRKVLDQEMPSYIAIAHCDGCGNEFEF